VIASEFKYQSAPHALAVRFSEDVRASLAAGDFIVTDNATGATIPASSFTLAFDAATNTAQLAYAGGNGVLPDGRYTVTVNAAAVTDAAGNALAAGHSLAFFFLQGDANHDGRVSLQDFNALAANFGQSPRDFTQADFTYDGVVNLRDFNVLAGRFGVVLGADGTVGPPTGQPPPLPGTTTTASRSGSGPFADQRIDSDEPPDDVVATS
jgi:hypothetical protein